MINFPFILTLYSGFTHAFETDHLLAVSNMVTTRHRVSQAVKDGLYWGLGHTFTILIVGVLILFLKMNIEESLFSRFEGIVGMMLITLGIYRLLQLNKERSIHTHTSLQGKRDHAHFPAFLIGLVHGLAGSGALMLLVISSTYTTKSGLGYLLIFGLGSVAGMMVAAALFSLPFSKRVLQHRGIQMVLTIVSSVLCIVFGMIVANKNLLS